MTTPTTSSTDRRGTATVILASMGAALTALLTVASYSSQQLADTGAARPGTITVGTAFLALIAATLILQRVGATKTLTTLDALFSGGALNLAAVGAVGTGPLLLTTNLPALQVAAAVIVIAWATTGIRRAHRGVRTV